jgi:hypothetical protein
MPARRRSLSACMSSLRFFPCVSFPAFLSLRFFPCVSMRRSETADRAVAKGDLMLDEQQTLRLLSWTLGTVCIGTLVLSALSLH